MRKWRLTTWLILGWLAVGTLYFDHATNKAGDTCSGLSDGGRDACSWVESAFIANKIWVWLLVLGGLFVCRWIGSGFRRLTAIRCPQCDTAVGENIAVCPNCGADVPSREQIAQRKVDERAAEAEQEARERIESVRRGASAERRDRLAASGIVLPAGVRLDDEAPPSSAGMSIVAQPPSPLAPTQSDGDTSARPGAEDFVPRVKEMRRRLEQLDDRFHRTNTRGRRMKSIREACAEGLDYARTEVADSERYLRDPASARPPRCDRGNVTDNAYTFARTEVSLVAVWLDTLANREVPLPDEPPDRGGALTDDELAEFGEHVIELREVAERCQTTVRDLRERPEEMSLVSDAQVAQAALDAFDAALGRAHGLLDRCDDARRQPEQYVADPRKGQGSRAVELHLDNTGAIVGATELMVAMIEVASAIATAGAGART